MLKLTEYIFYNDFILKLTVNSHFMFCATEMLYCDIYM